MGIIQNRAGERFQGRGMELIYITAVFTALAVALVIYRICTRQKTGRKLHLDDYFIAISAVTTLTLSTI